ncbi:MAG: ankyrin repeat domain-containing protein [Spirochaetaceae bacterium]|nr:ankyrin repeat domain-containing protein [Spirochaetaceae bacterium]
MSVMPAASGPLLIKPRELDGGRGMATWEVLTAARAGDEAALRAALERDSTLANAAYWYMPPLHFAVREGHLEAVRLLVAAGADLTHRNALYGNDTLLQMAEDRGHDQVAGYLRRELRRRLASAGTRHPIHAALAADDAPALERLLDADRRLANRGDHLGRRPLHYAVEAGRRDLVDLLLDAGAAVDTPGFGGDDRIGGAGFRPLALALWHNPYWRQRNDYAAARHLLDRGAAYSITAAAALDDAARVEELLGGGGAGAADRPEECGKRALSAAAERGHERIVRLLLDAGADPNLREGPNCPRGYALWAAARHGHRTIAELLLAAGADPNAEVESSGTPTSAAEDADLRALLYRHGGRLGLAEHFHRGSTDTIAALLDARPALFDETAAEQGFTHCVASGHEGLLRLLLARGLQVPPLVTYCQTYLWRSLPLGRLLLEHGMDPDLPNWQQIRPLHHQAGSGNVDAARLFLEFGADPDAVDEEFRSTPLGWAARRGQREFVQFLLDHRGPSEPASVPAWARAQAWAHRRGHHEIATLLAAAQA